MHPVNSVWNQQPSQGISMKSILKLSLVAALLASTSAFAAIDDIADLGSVDADTATLTATISGTTSTGAAVIQAADGGTALIIQVGEDNLAVIQQAVANAFAVIDQTAATASKAVIIQK